MVQVPEQQVPKNGPHTAPLAPQLQTPLRQVVPAGQQVPSQQTRSSPQGALGCCGTAPQPARASQKLTVQGLPSSVQTSGSGWAQAPFPSQKPGAWNVSP